MIEVKDKLITAESMKVIHEYNKEKFNELSEEIAALTGGSTTEPTKELVEFDSVERNKVYSPSFPNGATLSYNTYNKLVTPGEVYYVTTKVIANNGYGVAIFFNGSTYISIAGAYPEVSGKQIDYEVTVPEGATIMRIIPGDEYYTPIISKLTNVNLPANRNKYNNYVKTESDKCIVKAKYNDTEDVAFEISCGGGNGLPDIRKIYTVNNTGMLNTDVVPSRTLLSGSNSDILSPHIVKAVNNANGDTPDAGNFTGGNHQTNNQGSGGAVTARSEGLTVKCDNVSVDGSAWGNVVTISWTNYIHGYNTSKADGTGREIMKEEVILTISGTRISVDVRHYALEDIVRKTYYGLQMVLNAFNSLRYIGGSNRVANACDAASESGNKNCRNISLETEDGDVLEIGIDNVDLGDFAQDGAAHSAFATSYGKSYFAVIMSKDFAQNTGEMTTLRGYYHITSK